MMPIIGRTETEARVQKYERSVANADPFAGLAQFSGTGIDLSRFPLDKPMDLSSFAQANAVQAVLRGLEAA